MIRLYLLLPRLSVHRGLLLYHLFLFTVRPHQLVELIVLLTQVSFSFHFSAVDVPFFLLLRLHLRDDVVVLCLHLFLKKLVELVLRGNNPLDIILDVLLGYCQENLLLLLEVGLMGSCDLV